jgi:hypothetical protein
MNPSVGEIGRGRPLKLNSNLLPVVCWGEKCGLEPLVKGFREAYRDRLEVSHKLGSPKVQLATLLKQQTTDK